MEVYTLNRKFLKHDIIEDFESIIWTERYYGDGEVELVVPNTEENLRKIPVGVFLNISESDRIMILETMDIVDGKIKFTGISILSWLDNRFIRTSPLHEDQYWYIEGGTAGKTLWDIVFNMCCAGSPYLNGTINIGISNPQQFIIPGLGLNAYDNTGPVIKVGIPYGPVYSALKELAETYEIGIQITLDRADDAGYFLGFRSYKGLDRTTEQDVNPVVRFSPQMDSFTDIQELQSIKDFKTVIYTFASGLKPNEGEPRLTTVPGVSRLTGSQYTGFDLRAQMVFEGDINTDMVGGSQQKVVDMLNSRALDELIAHRYIKTVDGEIVPESQFKYGTHYFLGDIIEVEGNTGVVSRCRITEYIRSQDQAGEKSYPTVSIID